MSNRGGEDPKLRAAVERAREDHAKASRALGHQPNTRAIEKAVESGVRELAKEGK